MCLIRKRYSLSAKIGINHRSRSGAPVFNLGAARLGMVIMSYTVRRITVMCIDYGAAKLYLFLGIVGDRDYRCPLSAPPFGLLDAIEQHFHDKI